MGREVRRVPKDWEHPKDWRGDYKPLLGYDYAERVREWKAEYEDWKTNPKSDCEYWEWAGNPPHKEDYMPQWSEAEKTHLIMYEDTSEGTPISPAFPNDEDGRKSMARWLADSGASAIGDETATCEQWLATIERGFALSAVFGDGKGIRSGVAFEAELKEKSNA